MSDGKLSLVKVCDLLLDWFNHIEHGCCLEVRFKSAMVDANAEYIVVYTGSFGEHKFLVQYYMIDDIDSLKRFVHSKFMELMNEHLLKKLFQTY